MSMASACTASIASSHSVHESITSISRAAEPTSNIAHSDSSGMNDSSETSSPLTLVQMVAIEFVVVAGSILWFGVFIFLSHYFE